MIRPEGRPVSQYTLDHFYYGQFIHEGKPEGEPRMLAATPAVTSEMVEHAVSRVLLPPLSYAADHKSWALVRGRSREMPFLLVQAQQGALGDVTRHYIIFTPEVLKAYGGNVRLLRALVVDDMPMYQHLYVALPKMALPDPVLPSTDEQVDDILELMTTTGNRMEVIERLLATITQGKSLVIQHAPAELEARLTFISGLLALLPSSARFGVTFATHSLHDTDIETQIRFFGDEHPPEDSVIFNWKTRELRGAPDSDDFTRFVISQLRLDTELVIKHNANITEIARWRLEAGDKLSEALSYAAKRLRMDEAVRNNQPVNKDDVGKVLAEDPSLDDELRGLYAVHLIKFSLAMRNMTYAQPVALLLRNDAELAVMIRHEMEEALREGQAELIYPTLADWMSNPLGPTGHEWINLTHKALLSQLVAFIKDDDIEAVTDMLAELQQIDPGVDLGRAVPKIIEVVSVLNDPAMMESVFLLAVRHMDTKTFTQTMSDPRFRERLPLPVTVVWNYIAAEETGRAPDSVILKLAKGYAARDPRLEPLLLVRFAELAALANHVDLLDAETLGALVNVAQSAEETVYARALLTVARAVDDPMRLPEAQRDQAGFRILQLLLALGDYPTLARQMILHAARIYPGDRQPDYLKMIERLFSEVALADAAVAPMLEAINAAGIKRVPYIVAAVSSIYRRAATPELHITADQLSDQLIEERELLDVVPQRVLLRLLNFSTRAENLEGAMRAARALTLTALQQGSGGVKLMVEMAKQFRWDAKARETAMMYLRTYIRQVSESIAPRAADYIGKELGGKLRRTLLATYRLRQFTGNMELSEYVRAVHITANLLQETAALYADKSPTAETITATLAALPGKLSKDERHNLGRYMLAFAQTVAATGKVYRAKRGRDEDKHISQTLDASADPKSVPDVMRTLSGALVEGRRIVTPLSGSGSETPFRGRSLPSLLSDFEVANRVLRAAHQTTSENFEVSAAELREEFAALWQSLPAEQRQTMRQEFVTDLQRIADLVVRIEAEGDAKVLDDANLAKKMAAGRYRPKSTLEFYRYISQYYLTTA
ncbi:MAG: hypothetical protein OHK0046_48750 [Anaerolineae bacterium]